MFEKRNRPITFREYRLFRVWKYFTARISKHYGDALFFYFIFDHFPYYSIPIPGDYWGGGEGERL